MKFLRALNSFLSIVLLILPASLQPAQGLGIAATHGLE
jgi:alpha-galactosidase